jgi:alpha-D-ribose 1-methylphosphonate 5-triphosphate synthase subunit PhnG
LPLGLPYTLTRTNLRLMEPHAEAGYGWRSVRVVRFATLAHVV